MLCNVLQGQVSRLGSAPSDIAPVVLRPRTCVQWLLGHGLSDLHVRAKL